MKVAFVCEDVHKRGGTERVAWELVRRMATEHEVHVYAVCVSGLPMEKIKWHRIWVPSLPDILRIPLFALLATLVVKRGQFDVVVSQGVNYFRPDYMIVHVVNAEYRKTFRRLRLEGNLADLSWFRVWERRLWFFFAVNAEKQLFRKQGLKIVTLSRGQRKQLTSRYPSIPQNKVFTIYNGVTSADFDTIDRENARTHLRREVGIPGDSRVMLFVGGMWPYKGLYLVVSALSYLTPDVHLIVVGKGDVPALKLYAAEKDVGIRVHALGFREDVSVFFRGADVFVFPSYYESCSLVVLEALAAGLPVIAAGFNGVTEVVKEGYNGFIVKREARDIAEKARFILSSRRLAETMGARSRAIAGEFTWGKAYRNYANILFSPHLDVRRSADVVLSADLP
jgi:glycosyltransferase involved in cell wall biosynthesis